MIIDISNVTYYMEIGQNIHDFKIKKSMQNVNKTWDNQICKKMEIHAQQP